MSWPAYVCLCVCVHGAPTNWTAVYVDVLIPGRGAPLRDAGVVVHAGTIRYVGPAASMPDVQEAMHKVHVAVLMPGMWDTHTHFGGTSCPEIADDIRSFARGKFPIMYERFACALRMARAAICSGITSVREVGSSFSQALAHVLNGGMHLGPHFHYASFALGATGGHADDHYEDLNTFSNRYAPLNLDGRTGLCDGVATCVKRVREQLRAQSDVIKVMATGGVLSAFDDPSDAQLQLDELKAIVAEAALARRVVAAHAHGAPGIVNAIHAGVRTIEHGSYGNRTIWRLAAERGVLYTPTISITQTFNATERPPTYDSRQWAKGQEVLRHHTPSVHAAIAENVTITTGTDCPYGRCDVVGGEVVFLHKLFGLSPLGAIQAATADAPLTLGSHMAPRTGQIRAGFVADMIALSVNPLDDITALADRRKVTHVWKAGKLVKWPAPGGGGGRLRCSSERSFAGRLRPRR